MSDPSDGVGNMVQVLVKAMVERPEDVVVTQGQRTSGMVIELQVDPADLGKVIGRQGRTARALRTLVAVAGEKVGKRAMLQILE
jgi:predicted RNA-binding protein YlqC (UPF0109 family)